MPKIVIDTSNAALVEQLRICRLAKGKLDKEDKDLTKKLKKIIQPFIDDAGFEEKTELAVQGTNLVVELIPSQGAVRTDTDKMAELVAPEVIKQIQYRTPYHTLKVKNN